MVRVSLSKSSPASSTSFRKAPIVFSWRRAGVSNSMMFPASNTIILSLSRIVLSRCATTKTVHSAKCLRIVAWIKLSVLCEEEKGIKNENFGSFFEKINKNFHAHSLSTELVASSKIRILFFLNNALPKHSNCLDGFYVCFKSTRWHGIKNYLKYFLMQFRWIKFKSMNLLYKKNGNCGV